MAPARRTLAGLPLAFLLLVLAPARHGALASFEPEAAPTASPGAAWREVDRLLDEQRLAAAAEQLDRMIIAARAGRNDAGLARALVRRTQVAIALGGYETAVESLRAQPWPEQPLARAAVELYDAFALGAYLDRYGWEIARRERVISGGPLDLKLLTSEQIAAEASRSFARVWARREELGRVPAGELEVLRPNDFPPEVRPTLRDAVAHLWSEQLANSSRWTPRELEELWKLDLDSLLDGTPFEPTPERLADASLHPLARAAALLGDLERWHRRRSELGAALEALRQRLSLLDQHFRSEEAADRIRARLADALPDFRSDPWWSIAMADLAAFWHESDAPEAWIRAREIALAGERAFPESPGALACRHRREAIEQPEIELTTMAIDGPRRRSIEIRHRNLDAVHFRAYRLPRAPFAAQAVRSRPWNERRLHAAMREAPVAAWSQELSATGDYRWHRSYSSPPLDESGRYLIVASPQTGFDDAPRPAQAVELEVSDLVLLHDLAASEEASRPRLYGLSGATGEPLAGAEAVLYRWQWERLPEPIAAATLDPTGFVEFDRPAGIRPGGGNYAVVVSFRGEETVWHPGYWPQASAARQASTVGTLIFTDRAIYRPGQKLHWKTLTHAGLRHRGEGRALADRSIAVRLVDPNGESVATAQATTNTYGTASGELQIPEGRLLGTWRLETDQNGATTLAVEEYKRPAFEVTLARPTEEPRLNRPLALTGEARYYFGLPVAAGNVAWRVVRRPHRPWSWRSWWSPPAPPRTVASGSAALDSDGRFTVRFTPEADEAERAGCGCFAFAVEAEVTDEGGETHSGALSLSLGWVGVQLALESDSFLVLAGDTPPWTLHRGDLDGGPRPGESAWRLFALEQPRRAPLPADLPVEIAAAEDPYATPGDRQRPRWAPVVDSEAILAGWSPHREVAGGRLRHGEDGSAGLRLPELAPGAYRLVAETRDRYGERAALERSFVVAAEPSKLAVAPLALPLELRFAEPTAPVGGTARLFVHSGIPGQTIVVEIVRGETVLDRRTLVAGRDAPWIEWPITAAERGGLGARAAIVADHQIVQRSAALTVPWEDKELILELASFRDRLAPGESETFRVTVRDADGKPLGAEAAELLAGMYDRSLDLFRTHEIPRGSAFWPTFGAPGPLDHALGSSPPVWWGAPFLPPVDPPVFSPDAFVAIDPYGVGGPGERGGPRMLIQHLRMAPASEELAATQAARESAEIDRVQADTDAVAAGDRQPAIVPRADFSETALFLPHLVTDATGSAAIEFRVPESLTSWKLWISAWTRELASGYLEREVTTAKEVMVRPYLPRFLREGDRAELRVAVNNGSERELSGELRFGVVDPESGDDLSAALGLPAGGATATFTAPAGRAADLVFPVVAPRGARPLAVRVEARAESLSDGELRPLPLLPSRLPLTQSRFAALRGGEQRELEFDDMRRDDPTRVDEQLVVTVDARLVDGVLAALPYLVDYPYECTEQTMNRFAATAILEALYARYPTVAKTAAALAERDARWQRFDAADPNRRLAFEETPWLAEARGGGSNEALVRVLAPEVARAVRAESLAKLAEVQLPSGAFPWFPGGPPSPYMTLYLMAGFARVAELGGEIPAEVVRRGWSYLASQIEGEWWRRATESDCCWELLTYANYVASSYPDPTVMGDVLPDAKRRELLDLSFRYWRQHAPQSKLQLALTLARIGRLPEAHLVLAAVMDSAQSDRDLGTYWAPEDRSWLWYNDTVETHAWALRALTEISPRDTRRAGLVQWLFLQKKLGHWKSTRSTAEVLHALLGFLAAEGLVDAREEIAVTLGGATTTLVFDPSEPVGTKRQVVLGEGEIDPERDAVALVEQRSRGLAFASATWRFTTESLPAQSSGDLFAIERRWFRRARQGGETTLVALAEGERLAVGDELEVQLSIRARAAAEYVHLRDPRPAGLEPDRARSGWRWDLGLAYYEETRDSGTHFFFESLPAGEFTLNYRLRAAVSGTFRAAPAELQSMYAPEFAAHSAGAELRIVP